MLLKVLNEMLSRPRTAGVGAYLALAALLWAPIQRVSSSLGVPGGWRRLTGEILVSLVLALVVFVFRPLRWHLIYGALKGELRWFKEKKARILVGVGPGGAIVAGMVAKLMGEQDGAEPEIVVIDRVYSMEEFGEIRVSVETAVERLKLKAGDVGVVVVTSEVHSGDTIKEVCKNLRALAIEGLMNPPVFAFLWSTRPSRKPESIDRFVLRTDQRGILPWPDAPLKEQAV